MEELSIEKLNNFLKSHSSGRISISIEVYLNHLLSAQVMYRPQRGKNWFLEVEKKTKM